MKKVQIEEFIPNKLEFIISGFCSLGCIVEFKDNKLTRGFSYGGGKSNPIMTFEVIPTQSEWIKFWNRVDELQIWKWEKDYSYPGIDDGVQWSLKIKKKNKTKNSYGSNSYPESFNQFKDAISELLGGLSLERD